jgi:hypothetical protein
VQYEEGVGRYGNQKKVSNDDLTEYVSVPFSGTIGSDVFRNDQYIGSVDWYKTETETEGEEEEGEGEGEGEEGVVPVESDEKKDKAYTEPFVAGESYTALVTLLPNNGWTFNGVREDFFKHKWAKDVTYDPNTGIVTINFPPSYPGSFSGDSKVGVDSAIDLIEAATALTAETADSFPARAGAIYDADNDTLDLLLSKDSLKEALKEDVSFGSGTDLGETGLVLSAVPYGYTEAKDDVPSYYTTDSSKWMQEYPANGPVNLVIDGGGRTIDLTGLPNDSPLITVRGGTTLTLRNITFKGLKAGEDGYDNTAALIKVEGGHLIIEKGTVIKDNTSTKDYTGGGVCGAQIGTIIMKGGEISGNKATHKYGYGGGIYLGGPQYNIQTTAPSDIPAPFVFKMEGGTITKNQAVNCGGGIMLFDRCTFDMTGGTISDNDAAGGGGVSYFPRKRGGAATMTGGEIRDNTATDNGGGVWVNNSRGIDYGTFTMETGAIISGNKAGRNGGGVYVGDTGTFIMNGGEIKGNNATGTYTYNNTTCTNVTDTGYGGGVYVDSNSEGGTLIVGTFTKTGNSVIYVNDGGNTASGDGKGHAVYVKSAPPKKRDSTADKKVDLDSGTPGTSGGWDE